MVVLPGGDIIVGEMGGTLRAYRQLEKKSEDGRPICAPPPRAHGTVKYTHPKDPTQPLLSQVNGRRGGTRSGKEESHEGRIKREGTKEKEARVDIDR